MAQCLRLCPHRLAKSTLTLIPLLGVHEVVFAFVTDEHAQGTLRSAKLFFDLFFSSFQVPSPCLPHARPAHHPTNPPCLTTPLTGPTGCCPLLLPQQGGRWLGGLGTWELLLPTPSPCQVLSLPFPEKHGLRGSRVGHPS